MLYYHFFFLFSFFFGGETYEEFLVYFTVRLIWKNEKSEKFWHGVNDKVWGSIGEGVGVVRKCGEALGEMWGGCQVSVGGGEGRCEGCSKV